MGEHGARGRNELLHALREAQNAPLNDTTAWAAAPASVPTAVNGSGNGASAPVPVRVVAPVRKDVDQQESRNRNEEARLDSARQALSVLLGRDEVMRPSTVPLETMLPEMIGRASRCES